MASQTTPARKSISKEERRALLGELSTIEIDSDVLSKDRVLSVFLPLPEHRRVLDDRTVLVLGDRGVGKSALFHFLQTEEGARVLGIGARTDGTQRTWLIGYAETDLDQPHPDSILELVSDGEASEARMRAFWLGHLIGQITRNYQPDLQLPALVEVWRAAPADPQRWLDAVGDPTRLMLWLDNLERELAAKNRVLVVTYDHLDRIGIRRRDIRRKVLPPLLALWLSFSSRYRHLRAKIFLRRDLFDEAVPHTSDVTKLIARSETLTWSLAALYRLLIRHMARGPQLRSWLGEGKYRIPLREDPVLGWMPPDDLTQEAQHKLVTHIVGSYMGKADPRTGYSYNWVPARLKDANGVIVPRSLLTLFKSAASQALQSQDPKGKSVYLLGPAELKEGLRRVSEQRVSELAEEHPVVLRLQHLRRELPVGVEQMVEALTEPLEQDDGFGRSGEQVLDELVRLGVCTRLPKGKVDVADIYRLKLGIERRGQKVTTRR